MSGRSRLVACWFGLVALSLSIGVHAATSVAVDQPYLALTFLAFECRNAALAAPCVRIIDVAYRDAESMRLLSESTRLAVEVGMPSVVVDARLEKRDAVSTGVASSVNAVVIPDSLSVADRALALRRTESLLRRGQVHQALLDIADRRLSLAEAAAMSRASRTAVSNGVGERP